RGAIAPPMKTTRVARSPKSVATAATRSIAGPRGAITLRRPPAYAGSPRERASARELGRPEVHQPAPSSRTGWDSGAAVPWPADRAEQWRGPSPARRRSATRGRLLRRFDPQAAAPRAPLGPHEPRHQGGQGTRSERRVRGTDRKSTRLNSSHQIISY